MILALLIIKINSLYIGKVVKKDGSPFPNVQIESSRGQNIYTALTD